jgi:hypothetical protein
MKNEFFFPFFLGGSARTFLFFCLYIFRVYIFFFIVLDTTHFHYPGRRRSFWTYIDDGGTATYRYLGYIRQRIATLGPSFLDIFVNTRTYEYYTYTDFNLIYFYFYFYFT